MNYNKIFCFKLLSRSSRTFFRCEFLLMLEMFLPSFSNALLIFERISEIFSALKQARSALPAFRERVADVLNIFGSKYARLLLSMCHGRHYTAII